jgi:hypothetical protein
VRGQELAFELFAGAFVEVTREVFAVDAREKNVVEARREALRVQGNREPVT